MAANAIPTPDFGSIRQKRRRGRLKPARRSCWNSGLETCCAKCSKGTKNISGRRRIRSSALCCFTGRPCRSGIRFELESGFTNLRIHKGDLL
jgi:hypothetical protein